VRQRQFGDSRLSFFSSADSSLVRTPVVSRHRWAWRHHLRPVSAQANPEPPRDLLIAPLESADDADLAPSAPTLPQILRYLSTTHLP